MVLRAIKPSGRIIRTDAGDGPEGVGARRQGVAITESFIDDTESRDGLHSVERGTGGKTTHGMCSQVGRGADYDADDLEFMKAMDKYRKKRPFPAFTEVLDVLKTLGWRKESQCQ